MHAPFTINCNGTQIVVETLGTGPPVVFAHGLTGTRQTTRRQLAPLCDRYTVVTYDQRGHGDSRPLTDPAAYDPLQMAEDLACVMDSLGLEHATVGGESMGAATALLFALRYPQRVDRLLLTAPAFGDQVSSERARFQELAAAIRIVGIENFVARARQTWTHDLGWPDTVAETVGNSFLAHDGESISTALDTVIGWVPLQDLGVLRTLDAPVCIVYWHDDPLHPAALTRRMVEILPNARAVEIPPLPYIFDHAEQIGTIFGAFLDETR
jgi:pimeloyl-ACP methyl ester carboxylesterase